MIFSFKHKYRILPFQAGAFFPFVDKKRLLGNNYVNGFLQYQLDCIFK